MFNKLMINQHSGLIVVLTPGSVTLYHGCLLHMVRKDVLTRPGNCHWGLSGEVLAFEFGINKCQELALFAR